MRNGRLKTKNFLEENILLYLHNKKRIPNYWNPFFYKA